MTSNRNMGKNTMGNKRMKYTSSIETNRYNKKGKYQCPEEELSTLKDSLQFDIRRSTRKTVKNKSILKNQLESNESGKNISQEKKSILETLLTQKVVEYSHGNGNLEGTQEISILNLGSDTNPFMQEQVVKEEIIVGDVQHNDDSDTEETENDEKYDDINWEEESYKSLINEKNMILQEMEELNKRVKQLESKIEIYYKLTKRKSKKIS